MCNMVYKREDQKQKRITSERRKGSKRLSSNGAIVNLKQHALCNIFVLVPIVVHIGGECNLSVDKKEHFFFPFFF